MEYPPNSTLWRQNCNAKANLKGANTNPSVKYGLRLKLTGHFETFITIELSSIFVSKQGLNKVLILYTSPVTVVWPAPYAFAQLYNTVRYQATMDSCFCLVWPY